MLGGIVISRTRDIKERTKGQGHRIFAVICHPSLFNAKNVGVNKNILLTTEEIL
jgi:hypothetical protein